MFTLKTIVNGDVSLRSEESLQIIKQGSDRFEKLLDMFSDWSNPDYAIEIPAVFGDQDGREVLQDDDLIVSEKSNDRVDVQKDCIAIIVTECESITHPNMKEFNGQMFEFIYKGESAYITDANGHTVEVVR
ncbi:hypothetical protein ABN239_01660 [Providencia vermicola]|uniref:hypothetical protein n=1 Tax=Providencia vermicola TaxID=333965 RepID=UPI0032DA4AA6